MPRPGADRFACVPPPAFREPFSVRREWLDDVHVLSVRGELDVATCPQLWAALEAAVAEGARVVVLDLGAVGFMDAAGLRFLLDVARRYRGAPGARVVLLPVSADVQRLIDVAGVAGELPASESPAGCGAS